MTSLWSRSKFCFRFLFSDSVFFAPGIFFPFFFCSAILNPFLVSLDREFYSFWYSFSSNHYNFLLPPISKHPKNHLQPNVGQTNREQHEKLLKFLFRLESTFLYFLLIFFDFVDFNIFISLKCWKFFHFIVMY